MSNYPFLVTSLNRLFQRWFQPTKSRKSSSSWGTQFSYTSSPAPQNEVSTSRINGDFVYFIFHHLWLVILGNGSTLLPFPLGDFTHLSNLRMAHIDWFMAYLIDDRSILILSYHRNHQNLRNTWHINRITLGCFLMIPDDLRRHRGYECIQAPYFAGAQLAHFAEQGVVQTIFGPPGLLLYGHSAAQTWGWVVWGYHGYCSRWSCQRGSHLLLVFESDSLGITGKSLH